LNAELRLHGNDTVHQKYVRCSTSWVIFNCYFENAAVLIRCCCPIRDQNE